MTRGAIAVLLVAGVATVIWRGQARAAETEPAARVVCIEVAGMAVRLVRESGSPAESAMEAAGGCAAPLPPAGLPGEHLVSALLDDGSALELRRTPGEPAVIARSAREALERSGWRERPASALTRSRGPAAAALASPDGRARALVWVAGNGRDADPLLAVAVTREVKP